MRGTRNHLESEAYQRGLQAGDLGSFLPPPPPQKSEVSLGWATPSFTPLEDGSRGAGGGGGWPR